MENKQLMHKVEALEKELDNLRRIKYEEIFETIVEDDYFINIIIDYNTGKIVNASAAAVYFYGYSAEELKEMHISEITSAEYFTSPASLLELYKRERCVSPMIHICKDGSPRDVEIFSKKINIGEGSLIFLTVKNITAVSNSEKMSGDDFEMYMQICIQSLNGIALLDIEGRFVFVNPALVKMSGYEEDNLLVKSIYDFTYDYRENEQIFFEKVKSEGFAHMPYKKIKVNGGKIIVVEIVGRKINIGDKEYILEIINDVSEKFEYVNTLNESLQTIEKRESELSRIKEELSRSRELLLEIEKITKTGGWEYFVSDGKILWTDGLRNIYEYSDEMNFDYIARSAECYSPEDIRKISESMHKSINEGIPFDLQCRLTTYKGNEKWIRYKSAPLLRDGKIFKITGSAADITETKKYEEELRRLKDKAEDGNAFKSRMILNISHEVRTPMNAIIGFSEMLNNDKLSEEERKYFTALIIESSHKLLHIIENIIIISELQTNQQRVKLGAASINQILNHLYNKYISLADSRKQIFNLHKSLKDEESVIITDKNKLMIILTNLLDNAFEFAKTGAIDFGYIVRENMLEFYVNDKGIGILPEIQNELFKPFSQAEKGLTRDYPGNGLGLTISKGYTELLGGEIWLKSVPGEGSEFSFSVPYIKNIL